MPGSQPKAEPWAAEIEVTRAIAGGLIAAQFPQLGAITLNEEGEGWDNAAYLVNGTYVFRFPRRSMAAKLIEREVRLLPLIAPQLPLAVPAPQFAGAPSETYPWPFAGYRRVAGRELSALRPAEDEYAALAGDLGRFLRALHALDATPLLAAGLPHDEIGRLDGERMMPKLAMRLRELNEAHVLRDRAAVLAVAESLEPVAARPSRSVCHGDLYARHVLVDEQLRARGIIDWGDVHYGDPAVDLSIVFSLTPTPARHAFLSAYGAVDTEALRLARFRAIYHSAMVAHYGQRVADADLLHSGLRGLELAVQ